MTDISSLYLLPPVFSLVCGIYLSVLAMARGAAKKEKILFVLVCLWYSLLAPLFISHHIIKDQALILFFERTIHFFYVYLPVIQIVFFHHILDIHHKALVWGMVALSFILSLTTQSSYYIVGLNSYNWGAIAKGGPAFKVFGLYGVAVFGYCVHCFVQRLRVEKDARLRLKFKYMIFSFGLMGLMTLMNLPAVNGVDFYPPGNFSFLPLLILAYGIFKHRLLEIRTLLHISLIRVFLSVLIVVPNYYLLRWGKRSLSGLDDVSLFLVITGWFCINFIYIRWIHQIIEYRFDKARRNLQRAETQLTKVLLELRSIEEVAAEVEKVFQQTLPYAWSRLYIYDESSNQLRAMSGEVHVVSGQLASRFICLNSILEKGMLYLSSRFADLQPELLQLLSDIEAGYVVPLSNKDAFVGVLALPEKRNHQPLNPYEAAFIENLSKTLVVAASNAVIFQSISTLKDRLQARTDALAQEVDVRAKAERNLKAVQNELQETNIELEKALLDANEMHAKIQISNQTLLQQIEDRKRIEAALRQSEETYRLIADNSTDVIWTIDLDDRFTYLSPSIFQLLGYTPQEMLALKISDVLTAYSYQKAKKLIMDDFNRVAGSPKKTRKDRYLEIEQVRKDGTTVWTEVHTRFIDDAQGNIAGVLGVTRDITTRRRSEQNLLYMAHHDGLTGLYNRKAFMELFENEVKYAHRYQSGLSLLFFDLDKFKQVNDTYGHDVGDYLIKTVAERLRVSVRETDLIARLGGDEFTILLRSPDQVDPEIVARRIISTLANPFAFRNVTIDFVSASIGIATYPQDGTTTSELLKSSDTAMYAAKKSGSDWLHFNPQMINSSENQPLMES